METDKKPFDLSSIAAVQEADLEILDRNEARTGWIWTFAGPGHPATVEADRRQSQRYLDREAEKERAQTNGRKWKGEAPNYDERRAEGVAYIISRLLRWSDMTMDGQPFLCNTENATSILGNPNFNIYDQANTFLMADKSFSKRSAKP